MVVYNYLNVAHSLATVHSGISPGILNAYAPGKNEDLETAGTAFLI